MDRAELELTLLGWLGKTTANPTGSPREDVLVSIAADKITTIGHLGPGQTAPDSGMSVWTITMTLYFKMEDTGPTRLGPTDALLIQDTLDRMRRSLQEDPSLLARGLTVKWRGTRGEPTRPVEAPDTHPLAVEVHLGATHLP